MFTPSRQQARDLFFHTWEKYRSGQALEGLENTVLEVVLLHPEYHAVLDERETHVDRDYLPESAELNPFLHLSLHLAISEQLAMDQPPGISKLFETLTVRHGDRHAALHVVLDCLGETVWQANRSGASPDQDAYLACLREHLDKIQ
jgi:hypothetical protein